MSIQYLRYQQPWNMFVAAPPRSGKSFGIAVPTLFSYPYSVIVVDFRGELWELTSGYRAQQGQLCIKWDPTSDPGMSARHNPTFEIPEWPRDVERAMMLTGYIIDPDGSQDPNHWDKTAYTLITAGLLHQNYVGRDKSIYGVIDLFTDPQRDFEATLQEMLVAVHDPSHKYGWKDSHGSPTRTHPFIASAARESIDRHPKERASVISTMLGHMSRFRDPILAENIRHSDFRISDLRNLQQPVSLYLTVKPNQLDRIRPLLRLFIAQLFDEFMGMNKARPAPTTRGIAAWRDTALKIMKRQHTAPLLMKPPYDLLFIADEIQLLGRHKVFSEQVAFLGGTGVQTMIICQDPKQLAQVYGPYNSIADMCDIQVAYAPNNKTTAESYSESLGKFTAVVDNTSFTGNRLHPFLPYTVASTQRSGRPLMTADEIMRLPEDEMLIFMNKRSPIRGKKVPYYNDPTLVKWSQIPPTTGTMPKVVHPWTYVAP